MKKKIIVISPIVIALSIVWEFFIPTTTKSAIWNFGYMSYWPYVLGALIAIPLIWIIHKNKIWKPAIIIGVIVWAMWVWAHHVPSPTPQAVFPPVKKGKVIVPNDSGKIDIHIESDDYLVVDAWEGVFDYRPQDGPVDILIMKDQSVGWDLTNGKWGKMKKAYVEKFTKLETLCRVYPDGDRRSGADVHLPANKRWVAFRATPEKDPVQVLCYRETPKKK